jgi:hypothetical protein
MVKCVKGGIMKRVMKAALAVPVLLGGLFLGGMAALGSSPSGGTVQVWGTPANGGGGAVVITGAVGDFGKSANANSSGVPTKKGTYKLLNLKKGTILLNTTQLGKDANNNNTPPTTQNATNCSATFVITDPVPVVSGTKAYAGISGSINITISFALVGPMKNGTCNMNANPLAQYGSISGSGSVSFG